MTLMTRIAPVAVRALGLACAAGSGMAAVAAQVQTGCSALQHNTFSRAPLPAWIGRMPDLNALPLPQALAAWDCRATRVAWAGLMADDFITAAHAARQRHGATRVGLVLGTSASTLGVSEAAYAALAADGGFPESVRSERLNNLHTVTLFVQEALALQGPCMTVSTACSSSAKAFAVAERWLRLDLADAVVVAGVDALCDSVLFGFAALGLVSPDRCQPFAATRRGISVGEAAGFALLERVEGSPASLLLLGHGESNDAHHMSSPHPQGLGAERALDDALCRAGLHAHAIDHLNLHGTGTPLNDAVEAALVARRFRTDVHACATKGLTGHTMGAAGAVGALLCLQALDSGVCPGTANTAQADAALGPVFAAQLQLHAAKRSVRAAASHAFGFGGNNAVLIFGRA